MMNMIREVVLVGQDGLQDSLLAQLVRAPH